MPLVVITTKEGGVTDYFQRFTALLSSINRSIARLKADAVSRFSLKRSHVSAIYFIYREGSVTASRLSTLTGEDKANISRAIHSLIKDGLVVEERRSLRARVRLVLTERGREIGEFLHERATAMVSLASENIPEERLDVMYDCLHKIDESLRCAADGHSENKSR